MSDAIERVKRALQRGVSIIDIGSAAAKRIAMADDGGFVVALADGRWCGQDRHGSDLSDTLGVVAGFNVRATHAAYALVSLRIVRQKDADEFLEWMRRQRERQEAETEVFRLQALALKHGYQLTKAPKPSAKKRSAL